MKQLESVISGSKRLTFKFRQYFEQERIFIEETINKYLNSTGLDHISTRLSYCLHEQATNAFRANAKRMFFIEKNLDINNPYDYQEGIKVFKSSITNEKDYYLSLHHKQDLYIKFQIKLEESQLYISIINNASLTEEEKKKIDNKFHLAYKYESIIEALDELQDFEEGAGLGLFSIIMILKELGVKKNDFKLFSEGNETHCVTIISV